jgi:hypothetical protein
MQSGLRVLARCGLQKSQRGFEIAHLDQLLNAIVVERGQ